MYSYKTIVEKSRAIKPKGNKKMRFCCLEFIAT
jgi:hypothetical protein